MSGLRWESMKPHVDILRVFQAINGGGPVKGVRTARGVLVPCVSGHRDSTPSLHLLTQEGFFKAFCCKAGGDAASLVQFAGLAKTFPEAIEYIARENLVEGGPRPEIIYIAPSGQNGKRFALRNERPVGQFEYKNRDGSVAYRVDRVEGTDPDTGEVKKRFDQLHPGHNGDKCEICTTRLARVRVRAREEGWDRSKLSWFAQHQFGASTEGETSQMLETGIVPDHPGTFRFGTDGIERIPYRLDELERAKSTGQPVFFVEGEKKVEALRSIGAAATCAASGAGWRMPLTWGEYFRGTSGVIIIPDCDIPGRLRCAEPRLHTLRTAGVRSAILELDATRMDGYDIADWIDERRSLSPATVLAELRTIWQTRLKSPVTKIA